MIPMFMVLRIRQGDGKAFSLWLPLFILWILLAPLVFLALPLLLLVVLILGMKPLKFVTALWDVLCCSRGLRVEVAGKRNSVYIRVM